MPDRRSTPGSGRAGRVRSCRPPPRSRRRIPKAGHRPKSPDGRSERPSAGHEREGGVAEVQLASGLDRVQQRRRKGYVDVHSPAAASGRRRTSHAKTASSAGSPQWGRHCRPGRRPFRAAPRCGRTTSCLLRKQGGPAYSRQPECNRRRLLLLGGVPLRRGCRQHGQAGVHAGHLVALKQHPDEHADGHQRHNRQQYQNN